MPKCYTASVQFRQRRPSCPCLPYAGSIRKMRKQTTPRHKDRHRATRTSQNGLSSASTTAGSVMYNSFLTVCSSRLSAEGITFANGS